MSPVWMLILAAFCGSCIQGDTIIQNSQTGSLLKRHRRLSERPVYSPHREEYDDFTFGNDKESEKEQEVHDFSYETSDRLRGRFMFVYLSFFTAILLV